MTENSGTEETGIKQWIPVVIAGLCTVLVGVIVILEAVGGYEGQEIESTGAPAMPFGPATITLAIVVVVWSIVMVLHDGAHPASEENNEQ